MATRRDNSHWRTKHERILEAAFEEFARCGFELGSMDKIALTGGVSKVTIYNHFETKEKLFAACIAHFFEFTFKPFVPTGPSAGLLEVVEAIVEHLLHPGHLTMIKLLRAEYYRCRHLEVAKTEFDIFSPDLQASINKVLPYDLEKSRAVGEMVFSLIVNKIVESAIAVKSADLSAKSLFRHISAILAQSGIS